MAIDVAEQEFQAEVLDASHQGAVVVDFWAAWCAPCRSLGPILERVAAETGIKLAKVDVDANQNLAAAFRVQSIPMVLAFKDGMVVDQFVGALPEQSVRDFFAALAPSEADRLAEAAQSAGTAEEKESLLRRALDADRGHEKAVLALAALLADRRSDEEARSLLERIPPGLESERLLARIELSGGEATDTEALRRGAESGDPHAAVAYGKSLAASGRHEEALEWLLRAATNGADDASKAMVDVFRVLGEDDPLTKAYRPKLAAALF
ncbi:MAG: thioredoxin [Actinomycetota bacterium]|nr:thioredoxin [Actinomycetota bacterium]